MLKKYEKPIIEVSEIRVIENLAASLTPVSKPSDFIGDFDLSVLAFDMGTGSQLS